MRGKRVTIGLAVLAAVAALGVGVALRDRILEAWWIHALESNDQAVREDAAAKLGASRSRRAVVPLARARDDERWRFRWAIPARALVRIGPQAVVETFESLEPPEPELELDTLATRLDTLATRLDTMGQDPDLRTEESMREVRACLRARSDDVRILEAAKKLRELPRRAARYLGKLRTMARSDPDADVRKAAADAVAEISGTNAAES